MRLASSILDEATTMTGQLPGSGVATPMTLRGVRAYVDLVPVVDECARRCRADLGSVQDRRTLAALRALPADVPVALSALTTQQRGVLRRMPDGCVTLEEGTVTRNLVPAVRVTAAVVAARNWRTGLRRATQFAPFCSRSLVLATVPDDSEELQLEARYFGVGVAIADHAQLDWLLYPAPFRPARTTTATWLFEERAFSQVANA